MNDLREKTERPDIDAHIAQILDALDCEPRGAWMPSEALVRAFISEIERLRQELAEARERNLLANERADNAVADLEEALDTIDGLRSDLDNAVDIAFKYGAVEWTRLNYPKRFGALLAELDGAESEGR